MSRPPGRPTYAAAPSPAASAGALPPLRHSLGWFALCAAASVLLLLFSFPPSAVPWLVTIALAPWMVGVCRAERAWVVHWGSFVAGWCFFFVALRWLMPVSGLGLAALAVYLGLYFPLAAWAVRTGRRSGISPVWTLPVVWVATEFLRGWLMTGFPWLFLAHTLHGSITLIQVSDITGAYGVTFLVGLVNGLVVELALSLRTSRASGRRRGAAWRIAGETLFVAACWLAAWWYGTARTAHVTFEDGPRIAVVQEDFPLVTNPEVFDHPFEVLSRYLALGAAAAQESPDLIVFPETAWSSVQNISFLEVPKQAVDDSSADQWAFGKRAHDATAAFARGDYAAVNKVIDLLERMMGDRFKRRLPNGKLPRLSPAGAPATNVLAGAVAIDVFPENAYPRQKRYNSAVLYDRDGVQRRERYDKIHLVPFGEVVPFRNSHFLGMSLHWLYRWLNSLSPFSRNGQIEYSLWSGEHYTVFTIDAGGKAWRFGTPICYEDVMPYLVRQYVWQGGQRRVDFLVNLSNDGWFLHSPELPQHLAIAVFRAVESRVGIARAVNTGISGFIDPNGRPYSLVERNGQTTGAGIIGHRVDHVKVDRRRSLYGIYGDWFAITCVLLSSALWTGGIASRWVLAIVHRMRAWRRRRRASA